MTPEASSIPVGVTLLSVSELTNAIKQLLDDAFPVVWVAGEISNLSRPPSGHVYFTLKDKFAQVGAVIWQSNANRIRFDLADGLEVVARGQVSVFAKQGRYQLYIEELQPKGVGALELALRQLKEKLHRLGYFAPERKRPLPRYPRRVALVTSPTGAAIRDLVQIITRRWPAVELWLCPVRVQGDGAAGEIAAAIRRLNQLAWVEVMIVGRGGGSLEDLWSFNEEMVALAIFESRIPVISAVGHEIDVTIADLVADVRAATPSEAAERVVPDCQEVGVHLNRIGEHLRVLAQRRVQTARQRLDELAGRSIFRRPLERIREREQSVDGWAERGRRAVQQHIEQKRQQLAALAGRVESLSPLNVLGRGYSLTQKVGEPALLRSAADVQSGDRIQTRLASGKLISRVEEINAEGTGP